jgi:hypothetical protein
MMVTIVTKTIIYDKAYFTVCALPGVLHTFKRVPDFEGQHGQ